jgi:hypothetical protein
MVFALASCSTPVSKSGPQADGSTISEADLKDARLVASFSAADLSKALGGLHCSANDPIAHYMPAKGRLEYLGELYSPAAFDELIAGGRKVSCLSIISECVDRDVTTQLKTIPNITWDSPDPAILRSELKECKK